MSVYKFFWRQTIFHVAINPVFIFFSSSDTSFLNFLGDDFLRLLLCRHIFSSVVLRCHRSFRPRRPKAHPSSWPQLPELDILENPTLQRWVETNDETNKKKRYANFVECRIICIKFLFIGTYLRIFLPLSLSLSLPSDTPWISPCNWMFGTTLWSAERLIDTGLSPPFLGSSLGWSGTSCTTPTMTRASPMSPERATTPATTTTHTT